VAQLAEARGKEGIAHAYDLTEESAPIRVGDEFLDDHVLDHDASLAKSAIK
jgi:hypothetical protein